MYDFKCYAIFRRLISGVPRGVGTTKVFTLLLLLRTVSPYCNVIPFGITEV